jgi:hypothetical protein
MRLHVLRLFSVHDFFTPQPQTNASSFFIKQILHDWSDEYCIKFLAQLKAAQPCCSRRAFFACHDPSADNHDSITDAVPKEAPAALLANYVAVNEIGHDADVDVSQVHHDQDGL